MARLASTWASVAEVLGVEKFSLWPGHPSQSSGHCWLVGKLPPCTPPLPTLASGA